MADAPLIGAHDMTTPAWAQGYAATASAGPLAVAVIAPTTARFAAAQAWTTSRKLTLLACAVQLAAGVVTALGLLATADVFTRLLQQGPTPERIVAALPAIAVVVAALAGRALLDAAIAAVQGALAPQVEQRAQHELHATVLDVELVAFDDPDFTELVDRASFQGVTRLSSTVSETGDLLASLVSVVAAVVTAGVLHPLLAPVVLVAALPQGWASVRSARLMFDNVVRTSSHRRRIGVTSQLITSRSAAAEVRAFTAQEMLLGEHRRIGEALTAEAVRLERDRTIVQLVGRTLGGVGTAVAYGVLAVLLYWEILPLALAGTAAVAMRTSAQSVSRAIYQANHLYEASFFLDLFRSCLVDARARRRPAPTAPAPTGPETITVSGLTFRYPGQDTDAVAGVDLTLHRGETVALVGENGSGKSTLAKLITGLYLPTAGSVAWDGVETSKLDAGELHDRVAVVLQETLRWPMTAENNVRVGRLDRTDPDRAKLTEAAQRSGTLDVVDDLADGWDTVLSREFQGGRDLSGGQWQRVAVARGLYRDAPVVVADEPTAALDARAEHAVFAALRGLAKASESTSGRITVLVTHRLANVRHADQILVLEQGRLIESGRHAELMARGGVYQELFALQAEAYGDEP